MEDNSRKGREWIYPRIMSGAGFSLWMIGLSMSSFHFSRPLSSSVFLGDDLYALMP